MLGLMFSFLLKGPLLGRIELAGGRTAVGGAFFGASGWDGTRECERGSGRTRP